jgi:hypothetical protein
MRGRPGQPELVHQPRRRRQVALANQGVSPFHLRDSPEALGLQRLDHSVELQDGILDLFVRAKPEVLRPETLHRRPELAHVVLSREANICSILSPPPSS